MENNNPTLEQEIKELRQLAEQNNHMLKAMRRHMHLSTVFGTIRLLFVIIPLIIALIYLPPFIRQAVDYYGNFSASAGQLKGGASLNLTELQKMLQSTGLLER